MAGNPRENARNRGFWDGGSKGHNSGDQTAGRNSGTPGSRRPARDGIQIDLDNPERDASNVSENLPPRK